MNYEHTPSDRVQVRSQGELQAPGACALCGSGNCEDGYVDFGLWLDFHGTVYLCITCTEQIIGVLGALTLDESKQLTETNNELIVANRELTEEIEALREYKSKFDDLLVNAFGDSLDIDFNLGEGSNRSSGTADSVPEQPTDESDSGESESKESVTSDGPSGTKRPKRRNPADSGFTV